MFDAYHAGEFTDIVILLISRRLPIQTDCGVIY